MDTSKAAVLHFKNLQFLMLWICLALQIFAGPGYTQKLVYPDVCIKATIWLEKIIGMKIVHTRQLSSKAEI